MRGCVFIVLTSIFRFREWVILVRVLLLVRGLVGIWILEFVFLSIELFCIIFYLEFFRSVFY